jgi:hypothetical protein
MKLLIENWNKFLNEDELGEGLVSAAKIAAMLASMGLNPQAPEDIGDTGYSDAGDETHQVEYEPEEVETPPGKSQVKVNTLTKNEDGTYSIIIPLGQLKNLKTNRNMIRTAGGARARLALLKGITGKTDGSVSAQIKLLNADGENIKDAYNLSDAEFVMATGTAR